MYSAFRKSVVNGNYKLSIFVPLSIALTLLSLLTRILCLKLCIYSTFISHWKSHRKIAHVYDLFKPCIAYLCTPYFIESVQM